MPSPKLRCPACRHRVSKVIDTRPGDSLVVPAAAYADLKRPEDDVFRIRLCVQCGYKWWTEELTIGSTAVA